MTLMLLLTGMLLGMINAAPIGPVGLICLRKNMSKDRWPRLFAGFGMAAAYGIIAFCVVFGLKSISRLLEDYQTLFQISGGLLLIIMGWRGLRSKAAPPQATPGAVRRLGDFSASFAMTLCNPVPFASFALILTTSRIFESTPDWITDLAFAGSVAVGTLVFWVTVNQILHHMQKRSSDSLSRRICHVTSLALLVFGVLIAAMGIF